MLLWPYRRGAGHLALRPLRNARSGLWELANAPQFGRLRRSASSILIASASLHCHGISTPTGSVKKAYGRTASHRRFLSSTASRPIMRSSAPCSWSAVYWLIRRAGKALVAMVRRAHRRLHLIRAAAVARADRAIVQQIYAGSARPGSRRGGGDGSAAPASRRTRCSCTTGRGSRTIRRQCRRRRKHGPRRNFRRRDEKCIAGRGPGGHRTRDRSLCAQAQLVRHLVYSLGAASSSGSRT